jgi:hypothetical protein
MAKRKRGRPHGHAAYAFDDYMQAGAKLQSGTWSADEVAAWSGVKSRAFQQRNDEQRALVMRLDKGQDQSPSAGDARPPAQTASAEKKPCPGE